jgi:hypothetical protein
VCLELGQQHVDLLPRVDDDTRSGNPGLDGAEPILEALVQTRLRPGVRAGVVVVRSRELGSAGEEHLHPLVVARAAGRRVQEERQAFAVGGPEHRLHVRRRPAVQAQADELQRGSVSIRHEQGRMNIASRATKSRTTNLDLLRHPRQDPIRPATTRGPRGYERASDAGIHQDKSVVLGPQVIFQKNLGVRAQIITTVVPLDVADEGQSRHYLGDVGFAIQYEEEVGLGVQPVAQEEY